MQYKLSILYSTLARSATLVLVWSFTSSKQEMTMGQAPDQQPRYFSISKMLLKTCKNECTKVQNPRYKDITLNAYTSALTKLSLKSIIIEQRQCGRSFLISSRSDSYLNLWIYGQNSTDSWRTTRYDDGQSPRNKASKIQKLAFRCFLLTSAKAKKFQDGERSIRLYTTISLQLRRFSKIATIVYQKDSRSFQQWV